MNRVIIVGGGLAGLTAAFRLRDRCQVVLIEAEPRLGGQIVTERAQGFVIERGAEGFVARSEAVPALARDLGMPEDELIGQSLTRSYGFDGQRLVALEPGAAASLLGFQVPSADLGKGIRSLRRGMGGLIAALEARLRDTISLHLGERAAAVEASDSRVRVQRVGGALLEADGLIIATSATVASALLAPLALAPARVLAQAPTLSSVTVELTYERDAVGHPLDGSGFVVSQADQDHRRDGLRACAFTSSKFARRAPPGKVSLRLFFRPSPQDLTLSDDAFITRAVLGLGRAIELRGEPIFALVSRWPNTLPVHNDAHRAVVAALEQALAAHPILLAGSAFHGAGIDAAVRSGERAASICSAGSAASGCSEDAG
jgi:oxygen-dependent protoporphyrinogen oxidase